MIPTNENYFSIFLNKYPSSAACRSWSHCFFCFVFCLLEKWDPHPAKECAAKEVTKYQLNAILE